MVCNITPIWTEFLMFSLRGKIKRIAFQFTPYSWVKFEWKPASTVRRWLAVLGIIFMVRAGGHAKQPSLRYIKKHPNTNSIFQCILFCFLCPVPSGGAQYLLLEVCAVDASRTLPGASPSRLFCERWRCGHEGNLWLHGWPVSCSLGSWSHWRGHRISMSSSCVKLNNTVFHLPGSFTRSLDNRRGWWPQ